MGWGEAFKLAFDAATDGAKAAASRVGATLKDAAAAVRDTAVRGYERAAAGAQTAWGATTETVQTGLEWSGEAVNTAAGAVVYGAASQVRKVRQLYAATKAAFGADDAATPGNVVTPCPGKSCDIYSRAYRESLIDSRYHGADDPRLGAAMQVLADDAADQKSVDDSLETVAQLRQRPVEEIRVEYQIYKERKFILNENIKEFDLDPIDALKPSQSTFMGSTWQLRYGQVVGDRFGMDPVFGSLLNPTGGLVGPGNAGLDPRSLLMPDAVAYHGAYHDAMGHLYTYFGQEGPGYNYMRSPIGLPTSNPLAGQATGVAEWEVLLAKKGQ
ncbi:MAG: hypothetical protein ACK5TK_17925 [Betaproteobacteria bacterium]